MRLIIYACALLVYAAALAALGSPWAGVAAAALSLAATIAFECIQASQRATEAEDESDGSERVANLEHNVQEGYALHIARDEALGERITALDAQVAALKRNAALNQVG